MGKVIQQLLAIALGAGGLAICAQAQTTSGTTGVTTGTGTVTSLNTQTATMDKLATNKGQAYVAEKNASSFIALAGSKDNALALVNGLRGGTQITLTSATTTGGTTGTTGGTTTGTVTGTTITPPTSKMGWGNVFISLSLAQKVLTQAGITDPTAAQLKIALMGGDLIGADGKTVTVKGVLQLRADGMGWGKIAQVYGTKLGPVVSELKSANKQIASASATTVTSGSGKSSGSTQTAAASKATLTTSKGVTTAGGTAAGPVGAKGLATANGNIPTGKGAGIVTASGTGNGHGNAFGKGVVSAGGSNGASATTSAAGTRGAGAGAGLVTATGVAAPNAATGLTTANGNVGHGNANGKGKGG